MTVLPIGVDNQQHSGALRLDTHFPDGVPTLFSRFVDAVRADKTTFVFEDERRQLEGDGALLALVLPVFGFVPFVAHFVYTYRNTSACDGSRAESFRLVFRTEGFRTGYLMAVLAQSALASCGKKAKNEVVDWGIRSYLTDRNGG